MDKLQYKERGEGLTLEQPYDTLSHWEGRSLFNMIIGFDLDDTIYDRDEVYAKVVALLDRKLGIQSDFSKFNSIYQQYSIEEYNRYIAGYKSREAYRTHRIIRAYQSCGVNITSSEANEFNRLYENFRREITFRPGVQVLLKELCEASIPLFILTNGPGVDQRNKLYQLGIDAYIPLDHWFISGEIGLSKPQVEVFKFIEQKMGVSAERMIYIGDSFVNDIKGASQAGWIPIHFDVHHEKEIASHPYHTCHRIQEIKGIIEEIGR